MAFLLAFMVLVAQPAASPLAPFLGVWDTHDTYYPVKGEPIVEWATRTCEMVMGGSYLQCETVATRLRAEAERIDS